MAGLLAAHVDARCPHVLDHIAVADLGPVQGQPQTGQQPFQPQIGHHRGHGPATGQPAVLGPVAGDQRHDLVTVDLLAVLVGQDHPVGVAVQGDAQIGTARSHGRLHAFGMGGAAFVVDVGTVGVDADGDHLGAQLPQNLGRNLVGGAVGAIDDDLQPVQPQAPREGVLDEFDVAAGLVAQPAGPAQAGGVRQLLAVAVLDDRLDRRFDRIGQLEPVRSEQLDAVVLVRVVRGRDHDAQIGPQRAGQHGHGRGRQWPEQDHVQAHGDEPGGQRRFDHVAGQAGVLTDHHGMAVIPPAELAGRSHRHLQRRLRGHRLDIRRAADPIGSK